MFRCSITVGHLPTPARCGYHEPLISLKMPKLYVDQASAAWFCHTFRRITSYVAIQISVKKLTVAFLMMQCVCSAPYYYILL